MLLVFLIVSIGRASTTRNNHRPFIRPSYNDLSSITTNLQSGTLLSSHNPSLKPNHGTSLTPTIYPTTEPSVSQSLVPNVSFEPSSNQQSVEPTLSLDTSVNPTWPTIEPTLLPSAPTIEPTLSPSAPSAEPTLFRNGSSVEPTLISTLPTIEPTLTPTQPSIHPTAEPTAPTTRPTIIPTVPTFAPTFEPSYRTIEPSQDPASNHLTLIPSAIPSIVPLIIQTISPSLTPALPSPMPTVAQTRATKTPSKSPMPSTRPSYTSKPSITVTVAPSYRPSIEPSWDPSSNPSTVHPSNYPISSPTVALSSAPSFQPTLDPSTSPLPNPSCIPFLNSSHIPSIIPSSEPLQNPSISPSVSPSISPSDKPSKVPSIVPRSPPSHFPSTLPSENPTCVPSTDPSLIPSQKPSKKPSLPPSLSPSKSPSQSPSTTPSTIPSSAPTHVRTKSPSCLPSAIPSSIPIISTLKPSISLKPTRSIFPTLSLQPSLRPSLEPSLLIRSTVPPIHAPTRLPSRAPSKIPSVTQTVIPSLVPFIKVTTTIPSCSTIKPTTYSPSVKPTMPPRSIHSTAPSSVPSFNSNLPPSPPLVPGYAEVSQEITNVTLQAASTAEARVVLTKGISDSINLPTHYITIINITSNQVKISNHIKAHTTFLYASSIGSKYSVLSYTGQSATSAKRAFVTYTVYLPNLITNYTVISNSIFAAVASGSMTISIAAAAIAYNYPPLSGVNATTNVVVGPPSVFPLTAGPSAKPSFKPTPAQSKCLCNYATSCGASSPCCPGLMCQDYYYWSQCVEPPSVLNKTNGCISSNNGYGCQTSKDCCNSEAQCVNKFCNIRTCGPPTSPTSFPLASPTFSPSEKPSVPPSVKPLVKFQPSVIPSSVPTSAPIAKCMCNYQTGCNTNSPCCLGLICQDHYYWSQCVEPPSVLNKTNGCISSNNGYGCQTSKDCCNSEAQCVNKFCNLPCNTASSNANDSDKSTLSTSAINFGIPLALGLMCLCGVLMTFFIKRRKQLVTLNKEDSTYFTYDREGDNSINWSADRHGTKPGVDHSVDILPVMPTFDFDDDEEAHGSGNIARQENPIFTG